MNERKSDEHEWLDKMHSTIVWRLIGPNIKNPFDSNVTETKLEDYSTDRSTLMEVCEVQAYMDETVILKVLDLTDLTIETVHPNLVNLDRDSLSRYLKESGVWDFIEDEFKKLQEECRVEFEARKAG